MFQFNRFESRNRPEVRPMMQTRINVQARILIGLVAAGLLLASSAIQADSGDGAVRVNLNRATAAELASLPGIGPAKAAAIIAHRESTGAFTTVESLEAVRGVGPALVAKLRPHVTLGSGSPASPAKSPPRSSTKGAGASNK